MEKHSIMQCLRNKQTNMDVGVLYNLQLPLNVKLFEKSIADVLN